MLQEQDMLIRLWLKLCLSYRNMHMMNMLMQLHPPPTLDFDV